MDTRGLVRGATKRVRERCGVPGPPRDVDRMAGEFIVVRAAYPTSRFLRDSRLPVPRGGPPAKRNNAPVGAL